MDRRLLDRRKEQRQASASEQRAAVAWRRSEGFRHRFRSAPGTVRAAGSDEARNQPGQKLQDINMSSLSSKYLIVAHK